MLFVQHIRLSADQLKTNYGIMEEGNKVLKRWAYIAFGNRKKQVFRKKLFSGEIVPGMLLGSDQKEFPQCDFDKIMRVKEIEWEMIRGFAPFITVRTSVWVERVTGQDRHQLFNDLYQEAHIAFIEALYGYTGKFTFMTYLWNSIDRRLRREVENMKLPMVPPSADNARQLVQKYEQFKQVCPEPITFDEYVIQAKLDLSEASTLSKALASVVNETDFQANRHLASPWGDHHWDYTAYDVECENTPSPSDAIASQELHELIQKCVELANLTDFQKDLLAGCQEPHHGWKAEVARKHGKSRTRAGQVLNQTLNHLKALYQEMKFNDEENIGN